AAEGSGNSANDSLLAMSPEQQAQLLTKGIKDCVGESPFPMGVTKTGKAKGYAYWSVRCKDGRSFAVQITPKSQATAAECKALEGSGKKCFKTSWGRCWPRGCAITSSGVAGRPNPTAQDSLPSTSSPRNPASGLPRMPSDPRVAPASCRKSTPQRQPPGPEFP